MRKTLAIPVLLLASGAFVDTRADVPNLGSVRRVTPSATTRLTSLDRQSGYDLQPPNIDSHSYVNEFYVDDEFQVEAVPAKRTALTQAWRKSLQNRAASLMRLLRPRQLF